MRDCSFKVGVCFHRDYFDNFYYHNKCIETNVVRCVCYMTVLRWMPAQFDCPTLPLTNRHDVICPPAASDIFLKVPRHSTKGSVHLKRERCYFVECHAID